jgi:hypothetical protein
MPLGSMMVLRFDKSSLSKAGATRGETEEWATNKTIRMQAVTFSNLRGRCGSTVVKPMVIASAKTINLSGPVANQEKGAKKLSILMYLVITNIAMRENEITYPMNQYGFWRREKTLPRRIPEMVTSIT